MELEEKGLYKIIEHLKDKNISLNLAVRDVFVDSVIEKFQLKNVKVVSAYWKSWT